MDRKVNCTCLWRRRAPSPRAEVWEDRTTRASCRCENVVFVCFYCETQICMSRTCNGIVSVAARLLAGWVSVTAGIVSERLNLSANLLAHLVAQTFKYFVTPCADTKLQPLQWCYIYMYRLVEKFGDFRRKWPFISDTERDRTIVTMGR